MKWETLNNTKPVAEPLTLNATLFPLHLTQNSVSVFCVYNNNAIILKRFKNGKLPAKQWTKREMQNTDEWNNVLKLTKQKVLPHAIICPSK